jgi:predicted RNase H-like nuclease (RuvC/YqgF family)
MYDHIQVIEHELTEARTILKQCLSIMPVGYVPTHTVENLPEMIGDLTKALAEETTEREKLERELAEARECAEILRDQLQVVGEMYAGGRVPPLPELPWSQPDLSREALIAAVKGGES